MTRERSSRAAAVGGRVLLVGATGTIGRAVAGALTGRGYDVVGVARRRDDNRIDIPGCEIRVADVADPISLARDGVQGERFDALVSCLASRTGAPKDAWAIDHDAQTTALAAAQDGGVRHAVLVSAICVQKPRLAFQHAKLAFEKTLIGSGLAYSIVRPTAFFKSLSGQIDRVRQGKPFLLFGDGERTACKPISDRDLAEFVVDCLEREDRRDRILPIGGPGPAMTPRAQGERLFSLLGAPARFRRIPITVLNGVVGALSAAARVGSRLAPSLAETAEFARIARYYATESMLALDPKTGRYDADATPSFGADTLEEHYARALRGDVADDRAAHALF